jgi:hypothetical protein
MSELTASIRQAKECDIPAILALLLTSFRQFPLFTFLYVPLDHDKDAAHDTVFFWRRRLLLNILDPAVTILVAEVPESFPAAMLTREGDVDEIEKESWNMLEWVRRKGKLSQSSDVNVGKLIVGFAIWTYRPGHGDEATGGNKAPGANWNNLLRSPYYIHYPFRHHITSIFCALSCPTRKRKVSNATSAAHMLNLEGFFWSKVYKRRDQDLNRYRTYLDAEETLSER